MTETAQVVQHPARQESTLARLDPQVLIEKAIEANVGIETMERLVALAERVREIQAKAAWYDAMAEFQRTCPAIVKSATARMPKYSYKFAPLDEICSTIQPVMGPLGLSMRWTTPKIEGDKVTIACIISHRFGHFESSGDVVMPIMGATQRNDGSGEGGANAAQRVGISMTYAKRYALLGIIGMAPEDDDDAGNAPADEGQGRAEDQPPLPGQALITEPQTKRFYAIARGTKPVAWNDEQIHDLLTSYQLNAVAEIPMAVYDAIVDKLKAGPKK
jgi:hypothetical protein